MPRKARIVCPGYLHHITQRGNNRQQVFHDKADYLTYLKFAEKYRSSFGIDMYAFCLMPNHVHFILKPGNRTAFAEMFRGLNVCYAQHYQNKYNVSGHLWQGRYFSCLLSGGHVREAIRYVDNNPVRARMVRKAWDHPWSSARAHMGKRYRWITLTDVSDVIQEDNWADFLQERENDRHVAALRAMTRKNLVWGSDEFIQQIEKMLGRRFRPKASGRPKK